MKILSDGYMNRYLYGWIFIHNVTIYSVFRGIIQFFFVDSCRFVSTQDFMKNRISYSTSFFGVIQNILIQFRKILIEISKCLLQIRKLH